MLLYTMHKDQYYGSDTYVLLWVVYCVVTDLSLSECRNKIGMMTAQHHEGPCHYHDNEGEWSVFTLIQEKTHWISNGHVN